MKKREPTTDTNATSRLFLRFFLCYLLTVPVAVLCTVGSMFYLAAPMGFLAIHFYNGEPGPDNKIVNMAIYPVSLLVIGLVAMFVL